MVLVMRVFRLLLLLLTLFSGQRFGSFGCVEIPYGNGESEEVDVQTSYDNLIIRCPRQQKTYTYCNASFLLHTQSLSYVNSNPVKQAQTR